MPIDTPNVGIESKPNKRRKPVDAKRIALRVERFKDVPPVVEGVQPLNPGFFHLERMRAVETTKSKAKKRAKVRGK